MRWGLLLVVVGCPRPLDPEQACDEIGYAIGARTEECTGDGALGEARIQAFLDDYQCLDLVEYDDETSGTPGDAAFGCALVLREVACENVEEAGDDLTVWMSFSPNCQTAVAPNGEVIP